MPLQRIANTDIQTATTFVFSNTLFGLGSAGAPSLAFSGDTNTGIFSPGADTIAFAEGGVESMRIDSSGNVGIGTSSPTAQLTVANTASISGQTTLGTGSPFSTNLLTLRSDAGASAIPGVTLDMYGSTLGSVSFRKAGGTIASPSATTATSILSLLTATTGDGINYNNTAAIQSILEATATTTSMPTAFTFATTPAGSVSRSERMRITSDGNVGIGTNSPSYRLDTFTTGNAVARFQGAANAYVDVTDGTGTFRAQMISNEPFLTSIGSYAMRFGTNNTERMRITSAGITLIGTTSASGSNLLQVNSDALVNGLTVGKGGGAVATNTVVGASAGSSNTTGASNSVFGWNALATNTTASFSTAIGQQALNQATGGRNTALGHQAGFGITSGTQNTYLGAYTQSSTNTGSNNVGIGDTAFYTSTGGSNNVGVGVSVLASNSGSNNTAIGYQAGYSNTTGADNTFVGTKAGEKNTSGSANVFIGEYAGQQNTTASENTFVGQASGYVSTTGTSLSALGRFSLFSNTTGSYNTAIGYSALYSNTTATRNTAVGYQAGYALTTGGANVVIGDNAFKTATTADNTVAIGTYALENTTGIYNTAVGAGAGGAITSGAKNTILGRYNGNQGNLDIRTASNFVVISDGDGNQRIVVTNSGTTKIQKYLVGNFTKLAIPSGSATTLFKINSPTAQVYGTLEIQFAYDQPGVNLYAGTIKGRAFWNGSTALFDGTTTTGNTLTWSVFGDSADLYFRVTQSTGVNINMTYTVIWTQYNPGIANVDTSTIGPQ